MFNVWNTRSEHGHHGYSICENFGGSVFRCMFWLSNTSYSNVSGVVNRKYRPRNRAVQLLTPYTDPERHSLLQMQHFRQIGSAAIP